MMNLQGSNGSNGWKGRSIAWLKFEQAQLSMLMVLWSILVLRWLRHLPVTPTMSPDSPSYLEASEVRPHGYPLFLELYRFVVGDLSYLPHTQWVILAISSLLLSLAIGWRVNNIAAALLIVVCSIYLGFRVGATSFWEVASDWIYEALLVSAAACLVWYFSLLKIWLLAIASTLLGMALITRNIGYAIVPVFTICVVVSCWAHRSGWRSVILTATLPLLVWCAIGAGSNLLRYGHFRIGSVSGFNLLGRGLVLAQPLPDDSRFKLVNDWAAEVVSPIHDALARIHNPILKALIVRQYYDGLRYSELLPRFEDRLPGWRQASDYERDKLAGHLGLEYIRNDLWGYSVLFGLDYLSLWIIPRVMTTVEREFLESSYRALGPLPFLTDIEAANQFNEYAQVIPSARPLMMVLVVRAVNLAFLASSAALVFMLLRKASRKLVIEQGIDAVFLIGAVHASYLATALMEAGLERYTAPTWSLMVAAIIRTLHIAMQSRSQRPLAMQSRSRRPRLSGELESRRPGFSHSIDHSY
jgi:hypothetical protein